MFDYTSLFDLAVQLDLPVRLVMNERIRNLRKRAELLRFRSLVRFIRSFWCVRLSENLCSLLRFGEWRAKTSSNGFDRGELAGLHF